MTEPTKATPTPIKLELSHVETIHVTTGSQKVASRCLVLKDSAEVDVLINHPFPVSKMIITDVIPLADDPDKAEVIFRNLTNEEVVEMSRHFLLPQGTLMDIFGDILENMGVEDKNYTQFDDEEYDDEEYDDDDNGDEDEQQGFIKSKSIDLASIIENSDISLPAENKSLYSITMSLAEAHLGQMICVGTNAPAFVLTSEKMLDAHKEKFTVWEDFIALLEFPYLDTPEYFDSTANLIQAVTGVYPLNLSASKVNVLRAKIINDILKLSSGSEKSLIDSFGLINPIKKILSKVKNINEPVSDKPNAEEIELFFIHDAINKIYEKTSPHIVAALIHDAPNIEEYVDDIDTVNEIFKNSGLEEMFENVLDAAQGDELRFLNAPTKASTKEEYISFYSAPITPYAFPEEMRPMVPKIQMPLLYENNWSSNDVEIFDTGTNSGEIAVAKLITIAVRFNRLKKIVQTSSSNLNPIGFLVQGLNFPGENTIWSFIESVALLADKDKGSLLFEELLTAGMPRNEEDTVAPEEMLQSATAVLIHRLGHVIVEEEWNKEALTLSLKNNPIMSQFVEDVFTSMEALEGAGEEHSGGKPCPIILATFSLFATQPNYRQLINELGFTLRLMAELNALKYTDFTSESPEWQEYLVDYLRHLLDSATHEGH